MIIRVWVVTMPDLGWDCVVGVFSGQISEEDMIKEYPEKTYQLFSKVINLQPSLE